MSATLAPSDIRYYLSTTSGPGFTKPGVVGQSGGFISNTEIPPGFSPFTNVTGEQARGGTGGSPTVIDFTCVMCANMTSSGMALMNAVVWLPTAYVVEGGCGISLAIDPTGVVPINSSSPQAVVAAPGEAPANVGPWKSPTPTEPMGPMFAGGFLLGGTGLIPPQCCAAFWLLRISSNPGRPVSDGTGWEVACDVAAPAY